MSVRVIDPGILTTVQDSGRFGYRHLGFTTNGAMDNRAARIANLLLGNEDSAATLEFTLLGPVLEFTSAAVICLSGGSTKATIDDEAVEPGRVVAIKAGQILRTGAVYKGCRGYLAVKGGFKVPEVLDSRSTFLRGHMGGYEGRSLREGDQLDFDTFDQPIDQLKTLAPSFELTDYLDQRNEVRFIYGKQAGWFTETSKALFCEQAYKINSASDRMGYRLEGKPITALKPQELLTEGTTIGTIQVPASGLPIVLMSDSQPTGGYPKIGEVISVDLPKLAQLKPGDSVCFQPVSLKEAQAELLNEKHSLNRLSIAAQHHWSRVHHE